ncbi:tail fiber domain-containing protein [Salmonella enterica]|nr:tail fiber domain-containing protein [Salmonella enterica]EJN1525114.1 tail fiber domain-containing protein [Escherichia coli]EJO5688901.1 tail fiber domain-containing protein [Salmonella enterica]ELQ0528949.1 tail fiber domain-containing protein [Shigella flexneri]ELU3035258.1 tail fiber domain-containing protein [Salmonella enterica]
MWYREGTITFTQGSDTLTGTGTFWNVTANGVLPGMIVIGPDNKLHEIKRVLNDTSLLLVEPYSGETQTEVPCRIITTYEGDLTQFSARFTALMTRMSADSKTMRSWLTAVDEVTLEREDGTEVTVKSLTQIVNEHNANQQWYKDNTDAIDAAGEKAKAAAASAAAAAESANTATTKATEANQSATAAAASESAAGVSASAAKTSETNAESLKVDAAASAATASAKATEAGESATSAAASKDAAKASEAQAATSASEASASASAASDSAAAAKTSETNASASEQAAAGSAADALASKNAAKESETHAASSAGESVASAAAAKASETNADASQKAAAGSESAAGLSAEAAANSATASGEYADAALASKEAAALSAGEAKKSETSAAASATTAADSLAGIEVKANEAAESAVLASKKATEASTSAGEAKISQTKAKKSEDKAYEYAQNAQSSVASVKWKGTSAEMDLTTDSPKWVKISRARMPQSTSTVYIEVIGGAGYEAGQPELAAMADIVLRTAAGDPKSVNAVAYRTMESAVLSVATVNTSDDNYDIYLKAGAGSQKLVVNLQSAGATVETLEVLEVVDALPEDTVEGTVYHRVISDQDGSITGSLVGNASTATVLQTARRIGGVSFDGSADINLPGVNIQGNQNTTGNAATATKLQTPRTINSVTFDGSADIAIPTLVSRGAITALEGHAQGALPGIQMYEAYNNGYPTTYGNILHMKGAGAVGEGELLVGWSGTDGAHAPVYVRSRRDTSTANWSGWAQVYTTAHKPTAKDVGAAQAFSASYSTGAGNWTTAEFIAWLKERGAFEVPYWMMKGSWSYADNKIITDTGVGNICLAGSVVEVLGNEGAMTIRVTTPTTTTGGGITCAQFTYINHGSAYSPAWRRDYNTTLKPTAADVGALPSGGGTLSGTLTLSMAAPSVQLRGQGTDTRQYIMAYRTDGATSWYVGKANNGSDSAMLWNYTGSNGIELAADGNVRINAKGKQFTFANNGNLGLVASLDHSSVPQGTYHQVALNTGTVGGKSYLRKFRGGNSDTIWHETVQGGFLRWATGNTDAQEELSISTGYGVRARGEITSLSANGLRVAYGNYGFFIRNDGGTTYFLLTASGDKYGSWNALRPLSINNASGAVSMGNGLSVGGGVNVTSGNIRIPTSSTSWIDMRNNAALSNSSAVATSSASAIIRQEHADRHYFVGGLGNSQFGFYMINKSRTANGTDANAYLQNDGTWVCGGNGSFNDVYIRSDRRSKRNIRKIERALDKLEQIEGVLYEIQVCGRYEQSGGLIAQDVQNVQPELVTVDHNDQSGEPRLRLNYNGVIGMLVEAVKELREEVRELRGEISVLKGGN